MGGDSIYELGPLKDIVLFFDCLNCFVVKHYIEQDWSLLADRFYRRYLRMEELEIASNLMRKVKEIFSELASDAVDWGQGIQGDINKTWLDAGLPTLDIIFSKHFENFEKAINSATHCAKEYGGYNPVRLSISNGIIFVIEEMRPLEQYDKLSVTDTPFWDLPEDEYNKSLEGVG